jgi:hypothetical protein
MKTFIKANAALVSIIGVLSVIVIKKGVKCLG